MAQTVAAGDQREVEVCGGRTVVVGVKLHSTSRGLLTWAMVKAAKPGDRVVALHVLSDKEISDRDGKSSLLSLVKAFDSVLAVYEGFCNLKQVDLKLKICKGSSIKKVLVREANSYFATEVIVGTSQNHHTIRSSTSVAKYCAKRLQKDCSIIAVDNGKVVFRREASLVTNCCAKGTNDNRRHHFLSIIRRSLTRRSKVLYGGNVDLNPPASCSLDPCANSELAPIDQDTCGTLELASVKIGSDHAESAMKQKCSICTPGCVLLESSCVQSTEQISGDGDEGNSTALVALQKPEAASNSISLLTREMPELRHGWPLHNQITLSDGLPSDGPSHETSVVQWAMQLPSRLCNPKEDEACELDGESGAIVHVGAEAFSIPSSPRSLRSLPEELEGLNEKYSATCRLFNYEELLQATSDFMPENLIGKGGSSEVYRGLLPDGKELAVKILKLSEDVLKEFVLEIEIITALHHKNIISLFGFCFEDDNLLLVYDFLSRGSLEENLHGNKDSHTFGWSERYKVALGIAAALEYLHNRSAKAVIHRDVKSSNILLSDDFEPQLSDFGLAKWASASSSHITCTDVAGTFGYLAPEYFMYGKVNDKIDVYAYGVVLLELLSGRKPISNDLPKGQESLVMWARPILNGQKVSQLLDPSLANNYDLHQMERMVLAATLCTRRAPRARPKMSIVSKLLQGDQEVTKWARLQVNASEGTDILEAEAFPRSNLQSHLSLALLDVVEESLSMSSIEQSVSLEDYLRGRWSRSSSLD
ncbi:protein kinase STUNTED-like [Diospyros lotus]|uniref:protein kinase STUNTED-like n=1 Tax=Diospyros lotus TaxID=55363 RepID=UPI00224FEABE|nr:protein kinase STUNTED-like [Diospyros lotus]